MERRIINPWRWQDKYGFVKANEISAAARTLVCSGQTAIDADGNAIHSGDIAAQLKIALDNLEEVLHKADFSLSDVVRMIIYTTDVDKLISVYESMAATSAAYNIGTNLGCDKGLSVKVFDEETVPKYLIGSEYKAMPLDPRTTTIGTTC